MYLLIRTHQQIETSTDAQVLLVDVPMVFVFQFISDRCLSQKSYRYFFPLHFIQKLITYERNVRVYFIELSLLLTIFCCIINGFVCSVFCELLAVASALSK